MQTRWLFAGLALLLANTALAAPDFPALTGRVVDNATLLDVADRKALDAELAALEAKTTDQLVIVTLPSLQGYPIEEFGYQLGRHWGIGQADKDNGVLLIVAPNEREVRIEVGRGLEPVLTDALSRLIIERAILPRFRDGDFVSGIKDGVRDIVQVLTGDAAEVEARTRQAEEIDWATVVIALIFWSIILLHIGWTIRRLVKDGSVTTRSSGGWGGSRRSGRSSGGFRGGGGSFGGGGASGRW
jgi:uncharacterized protein